jgi:hypothetical protein
MGRENAGTAVGYFRHRTGTSTLSIVILDTVPVQYYG